MNLEELRKSGYIIFECVSGSHAYGTNIATSDKDIRGIFIYPESEKTLFRDHPQEISDEKQDIKFYELEKFMKLAADNNPNIIELLWTPEDCIIYKDKRMDVLLRYRELFVSQKAYHTFNGYAYAQIQKAKGKNKKVNNPQPEERPRRENYCFVILQDGNTMPGRPVRVSELKSFNLEYYNCARLEQTSDVYRLYYYGDKAKGVFRGNENLTVESIPLEDEYTKFAGFMIFNEGAYKQDVAAWKSYWDWHNNRNDARWVDQENGLLNYDQKNMMHTVRLLLSGMHLLKNGYPIVRFEGEELQYLKDIRAGKFTYEDIMKQVEIKMKEMEVLKTLTHIPHSVDHKFISDLYKNLIRPEWNTDFWAFGS